MFSVFRYKEKVKNYKMNTFKIVYPQETLHHSGCKLSFEHISNGQYWQIQDKIICNGKNKWNEEFVNPMKGYGMYHGLHFLELTNQYFGFVQTYEHSRGGHVDEFLHILDFKGNLQWSFHCSGLDTKSVLTSSDKLWLLHTDGQKLAFLPENRSYYRNILVQLDMKTGQEDFHLAFNQLKNFDRVSPDLKEWLDVYENSFQVMFLVKRGEAILEFSAWEQKGTLPDKMKVTFKGFLQKLA